MSEEQRLRELFAKQRELEAGGAPGHDAMRARAEGALAASRRRRRHKGLAFAVSMSGLAAVLVWVAVATRESAGGVGASPEAFRLGAGGWGEPLPSVGAVVRSGVTGLDDDAVPKRRLLGGWSVR